MVHLMPHESKPLEPKPEYLEYIFSLFDKHEVGILGSGEIIKKSKLTRTQTLRSLEILIKKGLVAKDGIKNVFYLL